MTLAGRPVAPVAYRGAMGRLILILLAVLALFLVVSVVISALHFLFYVALIETSSRTGSWIWVAAFERGSAAWGSMSGRPSPRLAAVAN